MEPSPTIAKESDQNGIGVWFVAIQFVFAMLNAVARVWTSKESRLQTSNQLIDESVESLIFLVVAVLIGSVFLWFAWNLIARYLQLQRIRYIEALSIALVIVLFQQRGVYLSNVLNNMRMLAVVLFAGYAFYLLKRRVIVKIAPVRPWNYRESVAVFALIQCILTF